MKARKLACRLLCIGGIIELAIAGLHFLWPFDLVETGEYAVLTGQYRDLLLLSSLAIGLCLLVFGALSIYFSRRLFTGEKSALIYSTSQAILWGGRATGELIFPVSVPIYFIENPTIFVLPLSFLLCLMFLAPPLLWTASQREGRTS